MADNYVALSLSGSSRLSGTLMGLVNQLARDKSQLAQLKAVMDQMTDGVSFTTIESAFGIPTGKGQTVYNLVAGTVSELAADPTLNNLLTWLAGVI